MKISVIIPVYNVAEWLDECLLSLEKQIFTDFEVILIDDGSTDGSGEKCDEWVQRDSRFKVIHKENQGPSIARNIAIKEAKGQYLAFVDSDDWVEDVFLSKLYTAVVESEADIAECDVYRVDSRTGEKAYRACSGNLGQAFTLEEHMKYGYTAIWKCLIHRELFEKYNIEFPDCHSEAKAIYPLLIALSNKVVNIKVPLYNYRQFRKDSLTSKPRKNNGDENAIGLRAFDALIKGFKDTGIIDNYRETLQEIITYKLSDMLAASFHRRTKEEYGQLFNSYLKYLSINFPKARVFSYVNLGGYNLNRILWDMNVLHDASCRFNFSSLISIMGKVQETIGVAHKNKYREIMIERDIRSEFWNVIDEKKSQFLFMDFIEERFDILQYKEGYLTISDAYEDSTSSIKEGKLIERNSLECELLWKKSCSDFIRKMQQDYPECKIVLIKNYLCEQVGNLEHKEFYSEADEIRAINRILKGYYEYFEEKCPTAMIIETSNDPLYFTDKNYEYGAIPSHLNDVLNRKIARQIEDEYIARIEGYKESIKK